jgi:hypothetical protein
MIDDLVLFNRHGVQEDVLERVDLSCLHQTAELGDGVPCVLVGISTAAGATTAAATTCRRLIGFHVSS